MDTPTPVPAHRPRRPGPRLRLLVAGALAAAVSLVAADEAQTHFHVGASVAARAQLAVELPPHVLITAHDIGRGFVEVDATSHLDVRTNARAFALEVEPLRAPFSAVAITGLEQRVEFGSDGGSIVRRVPDTSRPVTLTLRYRLQLDASAAPGAYAWPVRFDVRPLALQ